MFYSGYAASREFSWGTGTMILILAIATAFTGYSLLWGQMSFWAVTVILNLVTVIPMLGIDLLSCVLGDVVVDFYTLVRIELIHFFLPMACLCLLLCHLLIIHRNVSATTCSVLGVHAYSDGDAMYCILLKDSFLLISYFFFFFLLEATYPHSY